MGVPVPAFYETASKARVPLNKPALRLVHKLNESQDDAGEGCVLKPWVQALSHKEQRALMSCFRGSDQTTDKNVKMVIRMLRRECQDEDDGESAHYLGKDDVGDIADKLDMKELRAELEHRSVHLFQHLMEGLCITQRERGRPFKELYEYLLEKIVGPMWGYDSDGP